MSHNVNLHTGGQATARGSRGQPLSLCPLTRRTLKNNEHVHGMAAGRKQTLSKNNKAAHLQFTKDHNDKPEARICQNVNFNDNYKY
uniref:Uncharacterized protein n=1 Tax=Neolamprologus brichardi TaxID=32507 RepID=A0A3Q4GR74_NEOBR